jgi:hypothetical protein
MNKMKITRKNLRKIIKEAIHNTINEQGTLADVYSGGDPAFALTTAQVMAAMDSGLSQGIDLKGILFNATQLHDSAALQVLNHPAFQADPRVKKYGY